MRAVIVEQMDCGQTSTSSLAIGGSSVEDVADWLAKATGATISPGGSWTLDFPETVEDSLLQELQGPLEGMNVKQSLAVLDSVDEIVGKDETDTASAIAQRVLEKDLPDVDWRLSLLTAVYAAVRRSGAASGAIEEG